MKDLFKSELFLILKRSESVITGIELKKVEGEDILFTERLLAAKHILNIILLNPLILMVGHLVSAVIKSLIIAISNLSWLN